jgi:hypothetical protein
LQSKNTEKQVNLTINTISEIFKGFETGFNDNANSSSSPLNNLIKNFEISLNAQSTNIDILPIKNILEEIQILIDKPAFVIFKLHEEFPEVISDTNKLYEKIITSNQITFEDSIAFARLVEFFSSIAIIDESINSFTKNITEPQNIEERLENILNKEIDNSTQAQSSNINKVITKLLSTQYSNFIEDVALFNAKSIDTLQNSTDQAATAFAKSLESLSQNIVDSSFITPNKLPEDPINTSMNGRIKLSSEVYDSEDYYEVFQDFQPLTQLS